MKKIILAILIMIILSLSAYSAGIDENTVLMMHMDGDGNNESNGYASFDGVDDYIYVADSSDWDFPGEFSIESWFKSNADGVVYIMGANPFSSQAGVSMPTWEFSASTDLDQLRFTLFTAFGTYPIKIQNSVVLDNDVWYHAVVARDSSSDMKLYLNGAQVGTTVNN